MARMRPGGTERQLVATLRAGHQVEWDATLLVLYPGFPLTRGVADAGIPVIEMSHGSAWDVRRMAKTRSLVGSGTFDVIHSSLWGANVFARLAAARRRRPAVVISERSVEDFRSPTGRLIDRSLRPFVDHYIGNSRDVVDFICRAHGVGTDRVSLIPNGIDRGVFFPLRPRQRSRAVLRIGTAGRLIRDKAFDVLVAAMPHVLAELPSELLIAGEGPERAALEQASAGLPVRLCGQLPTPEAVANFFRDLDLFVLPSRYEGMPNVVLEALACGVPVVATDVPGMRAATGGDGIPLVPVDDERALARAILAALRAPDSARAAPQLHSFGAVAARHREVFEAALSRRARSRS